MERIKVTPENYIYFKNIQTMTPGMSRDTNLEDVEVQKTAVIAAAL